MRVVVPRRVVVAERGFPAGGDVVGRVLLHGGDREDAGLGALQHGLVDVGGVDAAAVVEALFLKQDGHRIDLFAGGTAGMPDADERIGAQQRHDLLAEGDVEGRVAEHGRRVDGEVEQQPLHARGVMQHFFDQAGDGAQSLGVDALPDAAAQRGHRVVAEVEAVVVVDPLREQPDLDDLEIVVLLLVGQDFRLGGHGIHC